jgi:iron complex transport system ATP-binding protein
LNGKALQTYSKRELARHVAFLPQIKERMPGATVRELVALGRTPYQYTGWASSKEDRETVDWALDYMHLGSLQHKMVDELSGGERQRVWIAMVLAQNTPMILLDEPVTFMDIKHQWELLATIDRLKRSFKKTIISVFHDLNHAMEISDRLCLLHGGRVYQIGRADNVVTEEALEAVYGIRAQVCQVCYRSVVVPKGMG